MGITESQILCCTPVIKLCSDKKQISFKFPNCLKIVINEFLGKQFESGFK